MSEVIKKGQELFKKVNELSSQSDTLRKPIDRFRAIVPYCKGFLEECGFKIVPPYNYKYDQINKLSDLVDYFYERFRYTYPDKLISREEKRDLKIAKGFLAAIKDKDALSRNAALMECAEIVDTVVKNAYEFEYVFGIGFKVFNQDTMSFVTEKAIRMINEERDDVVSDYMEKLLKEAIDTYDGGDIGLLSDVEERDGKEKE